VRTEKTLRSLRRQRNLTLAELAQRLNVTPTYIALIEKGHRKLNERLARRMAKVLKVSARKLQATAEQAYDDSVVRKSWVSHIQINGQPLIKAFRYHLMAENKAVDPGNADEVRDQLCEFVVENLPFSITAELAGNKKLIGQIAELCQE